MSTQRLWVSMEAIKYAAGASPDTTEPPTDAQMDKAVEFVSEQAATAGIDPERPFVSSICSHGVGVVGESKRRPTSNPKAYREGWERIFGGGS